MRQHVWFFGTILVLAGSATAQTISVEDLIQPNDQWEYPEKFGYAVDVDGNRAIVGALDADQINHFGEAYIFVRSGDGWELEATLESPRRRWGYGAKVALSGDFAMVAGNTTAFPTTIYRRVSGDWLEEATLPGIDIFGSIDIHQQESGVYAVIGSDLYFGSDGHRPGAAHIYRREAALWREHAVITASDGTHGDRFGYSVSLQDDRLIVGAVSKVQPNGTGGAYIFKRTGTDWTGWTEVAALTASDGQAGDKVGWDVDISGGFAVVGTDPYAWPTRRDAAGSAYVFREDENGWVEEAKLVPPDALGGMRFGSSVAIYSGSVTLMAIGAPGEDEDHITGGAVYLYERVSDTDPWGVLLDKHVAPSWDGWDPWWDDFGYSVAISPSDVFIGAPRLWQGAAFAFQYTYATPDHIAFRPSDYSRTVYSGFEYAFLFEARGEDNLILEDFDGDVNIRAVDADGTPLQLPATEFGAVTFIRFTEGEAAYRLITSPSTPEAYLEMTYEGTLIGRSPAYEVLPSYLVDLTLPPATVGYGETVELVVRVTEFDTQQAYMAAGNVVFQAPLGTFVPSDGVVPLVGGMAIITYVTPSQGDLGTDSSVRVTGTFEDPTGHPWMAEAYLDMGGGGASPTVRPVYGSKWGGLGTDTGRRTTPGGSAGGKRGISDAVYVSGTFDFSIDYGGTTLQASSASDAFVARHDANGAMIWVREMNNPTASMVVFDSVPDGSGGLVLTALGNRKITLGGVEYTFPDELLGSFITRVSPEGNFLDIATVTGSVVAQVFDLAPADEGYYFSGIYRGDLRVNGQLQHTAPNPDQINGFFGLVDSGMTLVWTEPISGTGFSNAGPTIVRRDGSRYHIAHFEESATVFARSMQSVGNSDLAMFRFAPSGAMDWSRQFGGPGFESVYDMAEDMHGTLWVVGRTTDAFSLDNGSTVGTSGVPSTFLLGFGEAADPAVIQFWSSPELVVVDLDTNSDGGMCAAGYFKQSITLGGTTLTATPADKWEGMVAHLASDGSVNWATSLGGPGNDRAVSVTAVGSSDCVVTGWYEETADIGGTVYSSAGFQDGFMVRLTGPTGATARDELPESRVGLSLSVYPNPAARQIRARVTLTEPAAVSVSLVDVLGREVRALAAVQSLPGLIERRVDLDGIAPGVYFVRVRTGKTSVVKPLVVAR